MAITEETKLKSWNEIRKTLETRQQEILSYMKGTGTTTARELSSAMFNDGLLISPERNMVQPRLNELVKMGHVEVVGKRKDIMTNRQVSVYQLTL